MSSPRYVQMEFDFGPEKPEEPAVREWDVSITDGWDGAPVSTGTVRGTFKDACGWVSDNASGIRGYADVWTYTKLSQTSSSETVIVDFGSHSMFGRIVG